MNIPLPQQLRGSEREQLEGMKTYLYQLAQDLQFALGAVEKQIITVQDTAANAERTLRSVSESQTPKAQFSGLKALIIKSADIVNAYYEEINRRLSGLYVAQSDFGTYRQETQQEITENAQGITRAFSDMQAIGDTLAQVQAAVTQVNAWIKTGKLGEDENSVPIYGVEIGQQTEEDGLVVFRKFARLLSDRLSFFDQNGVEVSFIGDETMHITRAEISSLTAGNASAEQFRMGEYLWFTDADGHLTLS